MSPTIMTLKSGERYHLVNLETGFETADSSSSEVSLDASITILGSLSTPIFNYPAIKKGVRASLFLQDTDAVVFVVQMEMI